jgi:hypothetical protein
MCLFLWNQPEPAHIRARPLCWLSRTANFLLGVAGSWNLRFQPRFGGFFCAVPKS